MQRQLRDLWKTCLEKTRKSFEKEIEAKENGGEKMRKLTISVLVMLCTLALSFSIIPIRAIILDNPPEDQENLIVAQHTIASASGQVAVRDDSAYLYIKIIILDWRITETQLVISTSLEGIPQTKTGNPIPGLFQYRDEHDSVHIFQYMIPMTWANGTKLYIALHCIVEGPGEFCKRNESAWVGNLQFPGRNWAAYFTYVVTI